MRDNENLTEIDLTRDKINKALIQRLTNVDLTKCADLEAGDGVLVGCCGCGESERGRNKQRCR